MEDMLDVNKIRNNSSSPQVYEGKIPEPSCPVAAAVAKPERRRSRLGSIFNTNGTSQPEPYRKLILEVPLTNLY